jgi:oxygen-independent coproporphyrinogen III oxidase
MKHFSESFNKRSRLIDAPQVSSDQHGRLAPLDPVTLAARLTEVLRIQQDFFPCFDWVFPPPVFPKAVGPARARDLFAHRSVVPGVYSVYLHVPFCKTLCSFCYYRVLPGRNDDEKSAYVDYLLREMALYREVLRDLRCESVYVGGGTPTALDDRQLARLFEGIRRNFDLTSGAEVTIESAPGTLGGDRVALLRSLGVNRLSYGIQSLDEKLLATMNREYRVEEAIRELTQALALIGNINVDTMYGFADEREGALFDMLTTFERVGIPGLTIYSLDTQRNVRNVVWLGPPRDPLYHRKIEVYQQARELLASLGYQALFQNTFVKPGRGSYRHQPRRWENVPLVALGVGSMGYAPRRPYQNVGTTRAYFERLDAGVLPIEAMDVLSPAMELARQVTTQLRFARVDLRRIRATYRVDLRVVFRDLIGALGELGFLRRDGDEIFLTPAAAPYNNVLPMLFSPDAFKQGLLGLPEDYLAAMPTPLVLTRLGATQSAPFPLDDEPDDESDAPALYADGSCPVVAR